MPTSLVPVAIASTYTSGSKPIALPAHLAWATPDTAAALSLLATDVAAAGGALRLSDLFRSRAMQAAAHADYLRGAKAAYSPPPGGSLHEAGRACDIDLAAIGMPLPRFWTLAAARGFTPIVATPDSRLAEAWHFERRGSHALVHEHYAKGLAANMEPDAATAASAILAIGVHVDRFGAMQSAAAAQSTLIRLGHDIGAIDGEVGPRTRAGLAAAGLPLIGIDAARAALETLLAARFPDEWDQADAPGSSVVSSR